MRSSAGGASISLQYNTIEGKAKVLPLPNAEDVSLSSTTDTLLISMSGLSNELFDTSETQILGLLVVSSLITNELG